ncbi:MAG: hypothetical protein CVU57_12970 [Deltaproteobacteria bacterium HGW-Deltaproteobacteria-15]|jgi:hypothetical protein|nr:MAG: hypothetical protein CVU57_12970 [Deltaproteobacteria bacterium HGW-Deltaproteobacteria-15]
MKDWDWKRVRHVTLSFDPGEFKNGREAWEHANDHKSIAGLVRNIERGKKVWDKEKKKWVVLYPPLKVRDWKWFLEWHQNDFPHYHLFLEMEDEGKAGMIGEDRIHHYWRKGRWINEDYIKSEEHWKNQTGYFEKTGYFAKDKEHQGRLPDWAMDVPGLKIRRGGSKAHKREEWGADLAEEKTEGKEKQLPGGLMIDGDTGEVRELPGSEKVKTYRGRLEACGECTRIRVYGKNCYAEGVFNVPYSDLKKVVPGVYKEGQGYEFEMSEKLLADLFDLVRSVQVLRGGFSDVMKHFRFTELRR